LTEEEKVIREVVVDMLFKVENKVNKPLSFMEKKIHKLEKEVIEAFGSEQLQVLPSRSNIEKEQMAIKQHQIIDPYRRADNSSRDRMA
jgi:hypothetical protein